MPSSKFHLLCFIFLFAFLMGMQFRTVSGRRLLPDSSVFNQDISTAALDPNSASIISFMAGLNGGNFKPGRLQIDFSFHVLTRDAQPLATLAQTNYFSPDCDDITCFPLPSSGAIEGQSGYSCDVSNNDCHLIVLDPTNNQFWESYQTTVTGGVVQSSCAIVWNMTKDYPNSLRGDQCTSCDAAGYPIAPLLFTPEEVVHDKLIDHAIRFILPNNWMKRGYVHPATHGTNAPPSTADPHAPYYGMRFRLKSSFNVSVLDVGGQVVARALQKYGMFVADGGNIPLTAGSDVFSPYKYSSINFVAQSLTGIKVTDFEVVAPLSSLQPITFDCVRNAGTTVVAPCSTSGGSSPSPVPSSSAGGSSSRSPIPSPSSSGGSSPSPVASPSSGGGSPSSAPSKSSSSSGGSQSPVPSKSKGGSSPSPAQSSSAGGPSSKSPVPSPSKGSASSKSPSLLASPSSSSSHSVVRTVSLSIAKLIALGLALLLSQHITS